MRTALWGIGGVVAKAAGRRRAVKTYRKKRRAGGPAVAANIARYRANIISSYYCPTKGGTGTQAHIIHFSGQYSAGAKVEMANVDRAKVGWGDSDDWSALERAKRPLMPVNRTPPKNSWLWR